MIETTFRARAGGPGFLASDIRAKYLALARGNMDLAFNLACRDVAETTRGGMYRPKPIDGEAVVNVQQPEAI